MKKLLIIITIAALISIPVLATAQKTENDQSVTNEINKIFEFKKFTDPKTGKEGNQNLESLRKNVTSNKEKTYSDFIADFIKILTGVAVVMTFVGLIVAGGFFVFSEGEEGRVTKARTIMIYVIIGDLIIAVSYAVIRSITLIKPLQ
jgi:peptidoglycan biosynthesis protein MviN/MurJ (putative lipid II flippase)